MQRGRACKGGSEVGRGYRSLPTAVFRVVRARSAWAKNPKKCRGPCWPPAGVRPCASKERQGGFRIGGAEACGMESGMDAGASGHGMRPVGDCWAPAGIGDDAAARTKAGSRVVANRSETGRHFPRRLRRICARERWRRDGSPHGTATVLRDTSVERRRRADVGLRREIGAH